MAVKTKKLNTQEYVSWKENSISKVTKNCLEGNQLENLIYYRKKETK